MKKVFKKLQNTQFDFHGTKVVLKYLFSQTLEKSKHTRRIDFRHFRKNSNKDSPGISIMDVASSDIILNMINNAE